MNKGSVKKALGFILSLLIVAYFISDRLIYFTPGGSLERCASYFIYPVLLMQHRVVAPVKNYFQQRRTVQELMVTLTKVQTERDAVLLQNIELNALVDYNQQITELVDFKKRYLTDNAFIAHVVAKHFSEQSHYFLIDAGERKGIRPDMVAVYNNCLVGKVIEVYPWYSKVLLITDKNCKVAAMCSSSKVNGIYEGMNDLATGNLNHVSHLATLSYDDLLLSNGEGLIFPKGFGLGKIKSYQVHGLFYNVVVEPLVDLRTINYCALIERDGSAMNNPLAIVAASKPKAPKIAVNA